MEKLKKCVAFILLGELFVSAVVIPLIFAKKVYSNISTEVIIKIGFIAAAIYVTIAVIAVLLEDTEPKQIKGVNIIKRATQKKANEDPADKILDLVYDYGQDFFVEEKYMQENDFNQMLNELKKEIEIKEPSQ